MKQGDIIAREIVWEVGHIVFSNASSKENADNFMRESFPKLSYEVTADEDNPNALCVKLTQEHRYNEEVKVGWVVDDEMAIQFNDGTFRLVTISKEPEWHVIHESAPSYQSSVAQMSDEELRASIDALRNGRMPVTKKAREPREPTVDKNDPLAVALANMAPDKKAELMRKMGMVD